VRARRSVAIGTAVCALGLTSIFSSSAVQPTVGAPAVTWGVNTNYRWSTSTDIAAADLPLLGRSGVTAVREDVLWDVVEPEQGTFDWSRYDALIAVDARNGLTVLPLFSGSAEWANKEGRPNRPPDDLTTYVDLVSAYLARYGPDGTYWADNPGVPAHPTDAVEVWNEPWYARFWGPRGADSATYALMVRAVADMVHTQFPTVRVVANGDWKWDHAIGGFWIDQLLTTDPTLVDVVDAFAAHPYPYPFSSAAANCASTRSELASIRYRLALTTRPDIPVWVTELGVLVHLPDGSPTYSGTGGSDYLRCVLTSPELATWLGNPTRFYLFLYQRTTLAEDPEDSGYDLLTADGWPTDVLSTYLDLVRSSRLAVVRGTCGLVERTNPPTTAGSPSTPQLGRRPSLRQAVRCSLPGSGG